MYKLRPYASNNIMKNLYFSVIHPHLLYAIQVWGSTFKTYIDKLFISQKKAVRLITNSSQRYANGEYVHTAPLFKSLEIFRLGDLFSYQILIFVHDSIHEFAPKSLQNMFTYCKDNHSYRTRSGTILKDNEVFSVGLTIPHSRLTNYGQKSIRYEGSKLWNSIPADFKLIESRNCFKNELKRHILSKY